MTNIFLNKLLFIVEILIAEILCTIYLKKKKGYWWRLIVLIVVSVGADLLFPIFTNTFLYSCLMFFSLFALTVVLLKFCYDEPWVNIFFCGIAAYTAQHFAYELGNLTLTLIIRDTSPIFGTYTDAAVDFAGMSYEQIIFALIELLCYFVVFTLFFIVFGGQMKKSGGLRVRNFNTLLIAGVGLIVDIVLNAGYIYTEQSPGVTGSIIVYAANCLCCMLLLVVQFELIRTRKLERELEFVRQLQSQEKRQYETFKENMDVINLKCHDMRHQIRMIGESKSISGEAIEEIESAITLYDTIIKTGNEVLDTILTEKSLRCYKNGILFSCVADGEKVGFMKDTDVYALFGNAMDNAIEAVLKIPEKEKRLIGFTLCQKGDFLSVDINNTYEGDIRFVDGLPQTTKQNQDFHGYGIKSIKMIVESYGGNMTIMAKEGVYNLYLLIPVPKPVPPRTREKKQRMRKSS